MACNENVIKNMANEVTRNCQAKSLTVDTDFVVYLIELLLLNPKYGKLFHKTLNRNKLEYFVNECVSMLTSGETCIDTMKMQHVIQTNYDKLQKLIDKHLDSIDECLRPLITEIFDADPELDDEAEFKKLFRKISIYIILASGLGNPGVILSLKEGMAALESVFSLDDLKAFVTLPRAEKMAQLNELVGIVSGVRLFNRDCKKGGDSIPDLPFDLVDAGKACLAGLSNSLISVMQRVNTLTSAIEDTIIIQNETGNVVVDVPMNSDLTLDDFKLVSELLAFNRQYEVIIRKLLGDVETMVQNGNMYVDKLKMVLEELHSATKYKAAVPVVTVFPLFMKLWQVWRAMQNEMYLVSTVNKLMGILGSLQDHVKVPSDIINRMLKDKQVLTDQDRMTNMVTLEERLSLGSLKHYVAFSDGALKERHVQYLGFCALCLCVGALVPSNMKLGVIKIKGCRYGFCSVKMAAKFSKDPDRYVNEVLDYARNNPQLINLLNIVEDVYRVKDVENLVVKYFPALKVSEKEIQTETHPIEGHIEKNYSWNLWEWKRRACQWASIVNCSTHATQTNYSHLRSEIHCQTVEPRDKCLQTMKDCGVNATAPKKYLWGLIGYAGCNQHYIDMSEDVYAGQRKKAQDFEVCNWPCVRPVSKPASTETVVSESEEKELDNSELSNE